MMDETWRAEGGREGEGVQKAATESVSLGTVLAEQYKSRNPMPSDERTSETERGDNRTKCLADLSP